MRTLSHLLIVAAAAALAACSSHTPSATAPATAAPAATPAAAQPAPAQTAPAPAAQAEGDGPYLFELLRDNQHQRAWRQMTASRKAPQWIGRGQGPTTPSQSVTLNGQTYWKGWLCQQHNCPNGFYYLLNQQRAYGLHADASQQPNPRPVFYGNPPPAERAALQAAFEQDQRRYGPAR